MFGMAGRVSEESLEAFNAVLARMKELLRTMPVTTQRQKKVNERLQGNLKAEVVNNSALVKEKTTGAKCKRYRSRKRDDDRTKVVSSVTDTMVFKDEVLFALPDTSLLPEKWRDVWDWYGGRHAPKEWRERLARSAREDMTEAEVIKEGISPY